MGISTPVELSIGHTHLIPKKLWCTPLVRKGKKTERSTKHRVRGETRIQGRSGRRMRAAARHQLDADGACETLVRELAKLYTSGASPLYTYVCVCKDKTIFVHFGSWILETGM